jgi:hypothetical protein
MPHLAVTAREAFWLVRLLLEDIAEMTWQCKRVALALTMSLWALSWNLDSIR